MALEPFKRLSRAALEKVTQYQASASQSPPDLLPLTPWAKTVVLKWGRFCPLPPAHATFQCLETFLVVTLAGWGVLLASTGWRPGLLLKPTVYRTGSHNKGDLAQNVSSAEAEKPWAKVTFFFNFLIMTNV